MAAWKVLRRKTFAQAESISAEHFNALGVPFGLLIQMGAADGDVKSILAALEKECGAVLR